MTDSTPAAAPAPPLLATARLQFHAGFTLDDAVPLVPYLKRLGVTHLYASPILKARPGSTHGYDIVDHRQINPELGGEPALRRLHAALKEAGLGLVLDIVPNHMGVGGSDNAWWMDVLEWGRQSPYAPFFDIDWEPPDRSLTNRLLAPFLGAPYGEVLASGDLQLRFEPESGKFAAWYYEHRFPIAPQHYHHILVAAGEPAFAQLAQEFGRIGLRQRDRTAVPRGSGTRLRVAPVARRREGGAAKIEAALAAFDPKPRKGATGCTGCWSASTTASRGGARRRTRSTGAASSTSPPSPGCGSRCRKPSTPRTSWCCASTRGRHRRRPHRPRGRPRRPARLLPQAPPQHAGGAPGPRAADLGGEDPGAFEALRTDWMVDGTTGYDFMDEAAGVLHDPAGEAPLSALWTESTGRSAVFEDEARERGGRSCGRT
jgi:(1->4)-alpha-D-glucan 1-alpha-D-glucosylmutase